MAKERSRRRSAVIGGIGAAALFGITRLFGEYRGLASAVVFGVALVVIAVMAFVQTGRDARDSEAKDT